MNESIIRSPKWLRNIVDFEINTGEDIKGEPSNKRRMKLKERQEEERVKNEIENLIGRMKEMNTTFKFENKKYNFTHLKRFNT